MDGFLDEASRYLSKYMIISKAKVMVNFKANENVIQSFLEIIIHHISKLFDGK